MIIDSQKAYEKARKLKVSFRRISALDIKGDKKYQARQLYKEGWAITRIALVVGARRNTVKEWVVGIEQTRRERP